MEGIKRHRCSVASDDSSYPKDLYQLEMLMPPVFQAMSKTHDNDQEKNHRSLTGRMAVMEAGFTINAIHMATKKCE